MYRLMQPSDEAAVVALWQKERGDSAEFIKTALEKFAGAENIYVAEENDEIVAAALAVPVTLKGRSGSYLYGLCGQGSLLLAQFLFLAFPEDALSGFVGRQDGFVGVELGYSYQVHLGRKLCPYLI